MIGTMEDKIMISTLGVKLNLQMSVWWFENYRDNCRQFCVLDVIH